MLDFLPYILDVSLDMPDELDLSYLRGKGLQPGEEELPERQEQAEPGKTRTSTELIYWLPGT